jgi:hypothetical protein
MQFGIQDDNVLLHRYWGDPNAVLTRGKQLGAQVVRFIVPWNRVETAPGQFDWSKVDEAVQGARGRGYRVHMTLGGTPQAPPGWQGTAAAPNLRGYANFVTEAAKRYRGQVGDFALYNEPDYAQMSPRTYRALYEAGRRAVLGQAPHARVYFGELSGHHPIQFTRDVLKYGPIRSEGFAWHPYQFKVAPESSRSDNPTGVGIGRIGLLQQFLEQHVREISTTHHKPLGMYGTEFGYLTRGPYAVSQHTAAEWWPRALREARKAGLRELIAYGMDPDNRADQPWDSSLLTAADAPRPAFDAIARARAAQSR